MLFRRSLKSMRISLSGRLQTSMMRSASMVSVWSQMPRLSLMRERMSPM